jgi:putative peptidoglycan lipid II flippase
MVFLLTVPSSIGLIVLGQSMIGAIYQGGKFHATDTQQTALALSCYAIGLAGYSALKVLNPAFYALHDARTPMYVSMGSIFVNYITAYSMMHETKLGHAGLALSTSAVAIFGSIVLFLMLSRRVGGIHGREMFLSVGKVFAASLVMGGAVWMSSHWIRSWAGVGHAGRLLDLALSIPVGIVVLYGMCTLLKVTELELATRSILGPVMRRLQRTR